MKRTGTTTKGITEEKKIDLDRIAKSMSEDDEGAEKNEGSKENDEAESKSKPMPDLQEQDHVKAKHVPGKQKQDDAQLKPMSASQDQDHVEAKPMPGKQEQDGAEVRPERSHKEVREMLAVFSNAYASLDRDHSGQLNEQELGVLGSTLEEYDSDHNGEVSLEEYIQVSLTEQGI